MRTVRDSLWLWGQTPNTHHVGAGSTNLYGCPGSNRMTALEGAYYLGIPNMCRVVSMGMPTPPFDQEAMVLETIDKVVWSIIGCGGSSRNNDSDDVSEVLRLAKKYPNVVGGIMDDFMNPQRMEIFKPESLRRFRERLNGEIDRRLDLWTVIYTHELKDEAIPYLNECDVASLWTWWAKDLLYLKENHARLRELFGNDKPVYAGCYMWDYGGHLPMPLDLMELQLETYRGWLKEGYIDGIIVCSNCIADIELKSVDFTRAWIREHGDEPIGR